MRKLQQFLVLVVSLLVMASTSWAQATLTSTTLSAAVTSASATTINVTVATDFVAGNLAYVDAEAMRVRSASGTTISVIRGSAGTRAVTHATAAVIYAGPPNYFSSYNRAGSCTSGNELVLPVINVSNGNIYQCTSSLWVIIGGPVNAGLTLTGPTLATPVITSSTGRAQYCTVAIGSVAYGSLGTSTTPVATTTYLAEVYLPRSLTLTGIKILNAATVGTDKWAVALYPSAGGAAVATSALAGTTTAGADAFQTLVFTATYAAAGPARYWIAAQVNGTTDRFRTIATLTFVDVLAGSVTGGTFGTFASLTAPTTFTADKGPIACIY